jgi:hypothetical protein
VGRRDATGADTVRGERKQAAAGYAYHLYAYFTCNASGARVAIRKTSRGADRFATTFAKKNGVDVTYQLKRNP